MDDHDDHLPGPLLARRDLLGLLGTSAAAALAVRYLPGAVSRGAYPRGGFGVAPASAAGPCVVRPEQTEGPYFVDELLNRSDIRSDPGDGSVRPGVPLTLSFNVSRLDGSACVPLEGVLVDVWHCDAAGVYSDVTDPGFDTTGQKWLRGYQVTDANGAAAFLTIYPGWYSGRTVHIHFKIRTEPTAQSALEFTSQIYFDDAVTDVVHALQPYAAKGQRTLRNAGDGIYRSGGDQLLLTPTADEAGGWAATFDIALAVSGTTTTTLAGGTCASMTACLESLESTLPDPATASSRKAKRTAQRLQTRAARVRRMLERAATRAGAAQRRLYNRARSQVNALVAVSESADRRDALGVAVGPIQSAASALLGLLASVTAAT